LAVELIGFSKLSRRENPGLPRWLRESACLRHGHSCFDIRRFPEYDFQVGRFELYLPELLEIAL
jgi:hypothetical protein